MSCVLKIVAISDTHNRHHNIEVPPGDVLVHAGDITMDGNLNHVRAFNRFLESLPHRHKIVIAGNHDFCFERQPSASRAAMTHAIYLQDSSVTLEGIKFYGSPWQPWFYDWAFNLHRGPSIAEKWALIPEDTDVLITHGPPFGQGDMTNRSERVGCADLLARVQKVKPRLHVFGHIHEGYGVTRDAHTTYVNACICTVDYRAANRPILYEYVRD